MFQQEIFRLSNLTQLPHLKLAGLDYQPSVQACLSQPKPSLLVIDLIYYIQQQKALANLMKHL